MPEWQGNARFARPLVDGTIYVPLEGSDPQQREGWIRVAWNGELSRATEADGFDIATVALERYVRLHGVGYGEDIIAAEFGTCLGTSPTRPDAKALLKAHHWSERL